jgi:hypothetical protein
MARISGTPSTDAVVGDRPTLTLPVSRACCRRPRRLVGMAQRQLRLAEERQPGLGGHHALGVRCSSRVHSSLSRRLICWLRADCTMSRSSAARPMLPASTTLTK